jgi:Ala-tRNA(Pro) deacylase
MPVQRLKDFLDRNNIRYVIITHSRAFTSGAIAAITHIPGKDIAKTVMVNIDGQVAMAVVPASRHLDLKALQKAANARHVSLVTEANFANLFPDCEPGAMPPFGMLYDLNVWVDEKLTHDTEIAFNAGTHRELIKLAYKDFNTLQRPQIARIATMSKHEEEEEHRLAAGY